MNTTKVFRISKRIEASLFLGFGLTIGIIYESVVIIIGPIAIEIFL